MRKFIILYVIILLAIPLSAWVYLNFGISGKPLSQSSAPVTPIQAEISKIPFKPGQFPFKIATASGTVAEIKDQTLLLKVGEDNKVFSLAKVKIIERLTSGSVGSDDSTSTKAGISDLKVGQEVLLAIDQNSQEVSYVLIIKP